MNPVITQKIEENLFTIKTKIVNMFLIKYNDKYISIDSGNNPYLVKTEMEQLKIKPESVTHVFLTHTCYDHTAGICCFKNAKVFLNINEEQMINGKKARAFWFYHNPKLEAGYQVVYDNDEMNIGPITVKVIETPGHTPGSTSYLINNSILFTGDTLALKNGKVTTSNRIQNMDTKTQKESIKKLANLKKVSILCTAHYGYIYDFDSAIRDWI